MVRRPSSVSAQDAHPPFDQLANTCENHKYDVDFFSFIVRIMPSMSQGNAVILSIGWGMRGAGTAAQWRLGTLEPF